jgi:hypothetical protein
MNWSRIPATLFSGMLLIALGAIAVRTPRSGETGAQTLDDATIEIPGLGILKLSDFPPEMRPRHYRHVELWGFLRRDARQCEYSRRHSAHLEPGTQLSG